MGGLLSHRILRKWKWVARPVASKCVYLELTDQTLMGIRKLEQSKIFRYKSNFGEEHVNIRGMKRKGRLPCLLSPKALPAPAQFWVLIMEKYLVSLDKKKNPRLNLSRNGQAFAIRLLTEDTWFRSAHPCFLMGCAMSRSQERRREHRAWGALEGCIRGACSRLLLAFELWGHGSFLALMVSR